MFHRQTAGNCARRPADPCGPGEGRGPPGGGDPLVDLRRRVGRGEGLRRTVPRGGRHLGRHRHRRRRQRAHRRDQSHCRRQSADSDAVQYRQAVRRPGRERSARERGRQEAAQNWNAILPAAFVQAVTRNGHAYAVPVNIHGQNWLFYSNAALAKAGVASRRPTGTSCSRRSTSSRPPG